MHDKRRYVKLTRIGIAVAAMALATASPAPAERVYTGQVDDARLAQQTAGSAPVLGYAVGSTVEIATRGSVGWTTRAVRFASGVAIDGVAQRRGGGIVLLVRDRDGRSLTLWDNGRRTSFRRDSKRALFGPAGLALDRNGRAVVAYALWFPSRKTYLRLAREDSHGRFATRPVTRKGFPSTEVFAAATPVVLPSGAVRVVETFLPGAIDWGLNGWGQLLFSSPLGIPTGRVVAGAAGGTLYAAFTVAFPTLGPPGVVLAVHAAHVQSGVALEDAVLGGLALTAQGPELGASRCIPAAAWGLTGNGVCGGLVADTGVDGIVADYAAIGGERRLLLQTDDALEWFASPAPLPVRVTFNTDFTGRVDGASGGSVTIYRELPGQPRAVFATVPLASDGSFAVPAPATAVSAAYRAVYVDPATQIPFAALLKA
jgi:hypothetical protein